MKRTSIKDVAREAGVSVTTTSYVLSRREGARISEETADKVRLAARRLGYVPNLSARTMINNRSSLIGVIIPQTGRTQTLMFSNPFYGEFLSGLEFAVRQRGYHLLISGTGPEQDYSSIAKMRQLDGIIILGTYPCDYLDQIKTASIPVVLVDAYIDDPCFHTVSIHDRHGGYLATKYLLDRGHQKIAFVAEKLRRQGVYEQRFLGYQDALKEAGIGPDDGLVYACNVSYEDGFRLASAFLQRGNGETAAFVAADIMAMGFTNGLIAGGKSVPEDVSVVGFDDVPLATMCLPPLTTVHQNIFEKGETAARLVIDAVEGVAVQDAVLPLHMVERASVKTLT